jgi:protein-S-isoprenylcysteine O-methyltransferase Ste14
MALVWVLMAFRTKRTLSHQRSWLRVWLVVVIAGVLILPRFQGSGTQSPLWERSTPLGLLALLMVAGGAAFGVWARLTIGMNWSGNVTFKEGHELIQSGPYRYVRHPIYSALLLMGLGSVHRVVTAVRRPSKAQGYHCAESDPREAHGAQTER